MPTEWTLYWRELKANGKMLKKAFGQPCIVCLEIRPKGDPSNLLPHEQCHVDGWIDPRPELDEELALITCYPVDTA